MKLLIHKSDIEKYFKISFHKKEEDINRFVQETQIFDLKPLVCEPFFNDLVAVHPSTDYATLLDGGEYEYKGQKVFFLGLKSVLCYFFYARYIFKSHQTDTPFGFVQKKTNDSYPISPTEKRDMQKMYVQEANKLWEEVKNYLNQNKEKYPIWEQCNKGCYNFKPNKRPKVRVF